MVGSCYFRVESGGRDLLLLVRREQTPSEIGSKEEKLKELEVSEFYHFWRQKTGIVVLAKPLIFESSDKFSEKNKRNE